MQRYALSCNGCRVALNPPLLWPHYLLGCNAGELLKLSGDRDPYPGDLGVIKEDAYADVLLVDGNPLNDIKVVGVLDNLRIIIKDGKVYKNTL